MKLVVISWVWSAIGVYEWEFLRRNLWIFNNPWPYFKLIRYGDGTNSIVYVVCLLHVWSTLVCLREVHYKEYIANILEPVHEYKVLSEFFNPLNTKRRLLYLKTQFVPRRMLYLKTQFVPRRPRYLKTQLVPRRPLYLKTQFMPQQTALFKDPVRTAQTALFKDPVLTEQTTLFKDPVRTSADCFI